MLRLSTHLSAYFCSSLAQENLRVFLFLLGKLFSAQVVHFDKAELVGAGQRRQNSLAIDKLAQLGHQVHALVAEKVVDEGFAGIDMGRFTGQRDVAGIADAVWDL